MQRINLTENSWIDLGEIEIELPYGKLLNIQPQTKKTMKFFNKIVEAPRYFENYGRDYNFSFYGEDQTKSKQMPEFLDPILEYVNNLGYGSFNGLLINWYPNMKSYIASHADDTTNLILNSPIVSISLGVSRKFRIRDFNKKIVKDIDISNGDILVMGGQMQKEFKHEIVKSMSKKYSDDMMRISLTFRQFK